MFKRLYQRYPIAVSMVLTIAMLAGLIALVRWLGLEDQIRIALEWIEGLGFWAPVVFVLLDFAGMLLMVPGILFTLGAGFIFGPVEGFLYVWFARASGGLAAFLIGRYAMTERVSQFFLNNKKISRLNEGVVNEGWKFVLLTRIVPFFPFKLSNYVFGMMGFRLRDFLIGNTIGIIPYSVTNTYLGFLAEDLSTLGEDTDTPTWVYIVGLIALVGMVTYMTRIARRSYRKYIPEEEAETGEAG